MPPQVLPSADCARQSIAKFRRTPCPRTDRYRSQLRSAIYFQRLISRRCESMRITPSVGRRNLLIRATLRPPGNVNGQEPFYVMMHVGECHVPANSPILCCGARWGPPSRPGAGRVQPRKKKEEGGERKKKEKSPARNVSRHCYIPSRNRAISTLKCWKIRYVFSSMNVDSTFPQREFNRCLSFFTPRRCNFIFLDFPLDFLFPFFRKNSNKLY